MSKSLKPYATPAIETLESSEILELVGPVQGYGPETSLGGGLSSGGRSIGARYFIPTVE